jgi:peroxidase
MTNIESAKNLPSPFAPLDKLQEKSRNFNHDNTDLVALQCRLLVSTKTYQKIQSCTVQSSDLYNSLYYGLHTDFNNKLFLFQERTLLVKYNVSSRKRIAQLGS